MIGSSRKIVLVTNTKSVPKSGYRKHMLPFDISKRVTNQWLASAIKKTGHELVWYSNLNDFVKNIHAHKNDLVFPYHHGIASKIRQSFVQTICEGYNIKYIGADAYSQTIGNDKALSKEVCRHAGIITPECKVHFDVNYPPDISALKLPLIVKPQFEGDSIGISDANVFYAYDDVLAFASGLLKDFNQPIIIEEYIEGRELSVCMIGYRGKTVKISALEYFKGNSLVDSYRNKKLSLKFRQDSDANHLLNDEILPKIENLFFSLDKMEFMRVDFIYHNETFYNIELTADPSFSRFSGMYLSFKNEMTYQDFVDLIISNCKERYRNIEGLDI